MLKSTEEVFYGGVIASHTARLAGEQEERQQKPGPAQKHQAGIFVGVEEEEQNIEKALGLLVEPAEPVEVVGADSNAVEGPELGPELGPPDTEVTGIDEEVIAWIVDNLAENNIAEELEQHSFLHWREPVGSGTLAGTAGIPEVVNARNCFGIDHWKNFSTFYETSEHDDSDSGYKWPVVVLGTRVNRYQASWTRIFLD